MGSWSTPRFAGKTFAFVGQFERLLNKSDLSDLVASEGAVVATRASDGCDYVVVHNLESPMGRSQLGQWKSPQRVISVEQLLHLLRPSSSETVDMLRAGKAGLRRFTQLAQYSPPGVIKISGQKFKGLQLKGINIRTLALSNVQFEDSDLSMAPIWSARNCRFRNCQLSKSLLLKLEDCSFVGQSMVGSTFSGTGCDFTNADLSRAFLREDIANCCFRRTNLVHCKRHLTALSFENCSFAAATLRSASMPNTRFVKCNFTGSDLSEANLEYSEFHHCNLARANLTRAKLTGARMTQCRVDPAAFARAETIAFKLDGEDISDRQSGTAQSGTARLAIVQFDALADRVKHLTLLIPSVNHKVSIEVRAWRREGAPPHVRVGIVGRKKYVDYKYFGSLSDAIRFITRTNASIEWDHAAVTVTSQGGRVSKKSIRSDVEAGLEALLRHT